MMPIDPLNQYGQQFTKTRPALPVNVYVFEDGGCGVVFIFDRDAPQTRFIGRYHSRVDAAWDLERRGIVSAYDHGRIVATELTPGQFVPLEGMVREPAKYTLAGYQHAPLTFPC